MGNCQAAEAATVVIHRPGNKIERIYWSLSAHQVMTSNPGHYVALLVSSPAATNENGSPLKHLKLLRPHDSLLIGHVYRLISFEEVLKELGGKKCVKVGKLLKERGGNGIEVKKKKDSGGGLNLNPKTSSKSHSQSISIEVGNNGGSTASTTTTGRSRGVVGRHYNGGGGQWKPALQSISEIGTS